MNAQVPPSVVVVFPARQSEEVEQGLGYGGIYRAALAQVEALRSAGVGVTVLTASVLFARRSAEMGARAHLDNAWHSGLTPLLKPSCWLHAWRARRSRPAAVLFHGGRGWLWGACFFAGIARVGVMHTGGLGKTKRLRYQLALNKRALETTRQSRQSQGMRFALVSNGLTGADLTRFRRVAELEKSASPDGTVTIGFMGRFSPEKGLDVLLQAIRKLRDSGLRVRLVLAGAGSLDVQAMAREAGVSDDVECVGWIDDAGKFLAGLDIFCLPSRFEPFGMVVLEAMAARRPVVTTKSGGPEEIIEHDKTGLLVPAGDATALAGALEKLVRDAAERRRLAQAAFLAVGDRFGPAAVGRTYLQAFEALGLTSRNAAK